MRSFGRISLALAGGACLLGLALCEVLLGFLRPPRNPAADAPVALLHRKSEVPGLAYEMVPNGDGGFMSVKVVTNSFGMRDAEPATGGGIYRIAAVGDSVTFGWGVEAQDAYPSVLERTLNEACRGAPRFDVMNFGVTGYSSQDEALVVRHKVLRFRPRRIVVGYVLNDPLTEPIQPLQAYFTPPPWWRASNIGRLFDSAWRHFQVGRLGHGSFYRYLHARGQRPWARVTEAFQDMALSAREVGADVTLAIFPMLDVKEPTSWDRYTYADIHGQVRDAARLLGFRVVDLLPAFKRFPPEEMRRSKKDEHPSALGYRIAAQAIGEALSPGCDVPASSE